MNRRSLPDAGIAFKPAFDGPDQFGRFLEEREESLTLLARGDPRRLGKLIRGAIMSSRARGLAETFKLIIARIQKRSPILAKIFNQEFRDRLAGDAKKAGEYIQGRINELPGDMLGRICAIIFCRCLACRRTQFA